MKAGKGDRIVIAQRSVGGTVRDGEILEVRGPHGAPPYLVRWSDNGHEVLYYPGGDAHIDSTPKEGVTQPAPATSSRHVSSWSATIDLFDDGLNTSAHAILRTPAPHEMDAHGAAHRRVADPDIPEIGDEIAVARALRHLADQLLASAADDIAGIEGHPVTLQET
jgi:hypothetical protein